MTTTKGSAVGQEMLWKNGIDLLFMIITTPNIMTLFKIINQLFNLSRRATGSTFPSEDPSSIITSDTEEYPLGAELKPYVALAISH
jgi:hypothetical protein